MSRYSSLQMYACISQYEKGGECEGGIPPSKYQISSLEVCVHKQYYYYANCVVVCEYYQIL